MLRRDFISVCSALGLIGCSGTRRSTEFDGSVVVVGAGVAGMSVGHLLAQQGISFTILEAAKDYGGRVKTNHGFVDFPIPLGGEWLHVHEKILSQLVSDDSVKVAVELASYDAGTTHGYYERGKLHLGTLGKNAAELHDKKFIGGTWLTFFQRYIVPGIKSQMRFESEVASVDYSQNSVSVRCANGSLLTADAVVITAPPQVIKDGDISFHPPLPKRKKEAFDDAYIWGGMKIFLEFKEKFYPTFLEIAGTNNKRGQKLFYDAAYGQKSDANVLGLFLVGDQAKPYQSRQNNEIRDYVLSELDNIFDGAASRSYIKHLAQNWNSEEYIRQAYLADDANGQLPPRMRESIDRRLFFAGDTYTSGDVWGSAHAAVISAREAVDELLG